MQNIFQANEVESFRYTANKTKTLHIFYGNRDRHNNMYLLNWRNCQKISSVANLLSFMVSDMIFCDYDAYKISSQYNRILFLDELNKYISLAYILGTEFGFSKDEYCIKHFISDLLFWINDQTNMLENSRLFFQVFRKSRQVDLNIKTC